MHWNIYLITRWRSRLNCHQNRFSYEFAINMFAETSVVGCSSGTLRFVSKLPQTSTIFTLTDRQFFLYMISILHSNYVFFFHVFDVIKLLGMMPTES